MTSFQRYAEQLPLTTRKAGLRTVTNATGSGLGLSPAATLTRALCGLQNAIQKLLRLLASFPADLITYMCAAVPPGRFAHKPG